MSRMATFRFTLEPSAEQDALLRTAGGAARLAYNVTLAAVKGALEARECDPSVKVPWSRFDLINTVNRWKRSELTGQSAEWHKQIPSLVFEEAAVDLSRALSAFTESRNGTRPGQRAAFPKFKKKNSAPYAFRIRDQRETRTGKGRIAIGVHDQARAIKIPKIGVLKVREDTRRLRRMLRPSMDQGGNPAGPRAVITSVTVRLHRGRWIASVAVRADDFHPRLRHAPREESEAGGWVGVDRGLLDLVVAGTDDGHEVAREEASKTFQRREEGLKLRQRKLARKQPGSKRRAQAKRHVHEYQCRTAAIREHRLHQVANLLVKNHDRLVIETLHVAGMLTNRRLAKALSDAAFGKLAQMLRYKAAWYGSVLVEADRWYPSSKICSGCGHRKKTLPLSERMFRCEECGLEIDRDLNAAINLARLGQELLERLGRDQVPDPGPVSSGPGQQRATQAPQRHRHATTDCRRQGTVHGANPPRRLNPGDAGREPPRRGLHADHKGLQTGCETGRRP